eukprot:Rmarinus@m.7296
MPPILIPPPQVAGKYSIDEFERCLHLSGGSSAEEALQNLRKRILLDGLPLEMEGCDRHSGDICTLRGRIWRVLLGVAHVDPDNYLALIGRGRGGSYNNIRNDTFRTFPNDAGFKQRVPEEKLLRVLSAADHTLTDLGCTKSYVQGMNVMCAPFLYTMPEVEAYHCYMEFMRRRCPTYVLPNLEGAFLGCQLLEEVVEAVDPELSKYLRSKQLSAQVYGFPSIFSLSGCTPTLAELVKLWDVMLAFGVHMNVMFVAAQVLTLRHELLNHPRPYELLRQLPDLNAARIVSVAMPLLPRLSDGLYNRLVKHPLQL